jgi:hypothetical protein
VSAVTAADVRDAIGDAARVLAASQEPDGGFPLAAIAGRPLGSAGDSLFSTAMVLALAGPVLPRECVGRAAAFIVDRRDARGLWGWAADGSLPPDADDTACCLGALARIGAGVDGREGARLLRKFWRWNGPFRTWLAKGGWNRRDRDDPVVNCNVLWALAELGARVRPWERRAVERMVARHRGPSRYYCSEASVAWAAARVGIPTPWLQPPPAPALRGHPLECALWTLAAERPCAAAAGTLLEMREADGGWAAEPWVQGNPGTWESRPVTIAFVIAALSRLHPAP